MTDKQKLLKEIQSGNILTPKDEKELFYHWGAFYDFDGLTIEDMINTGGSPIPSKTPNPVTISNVQKEDTFSLEIKLSFVPTSEVVVNLTVDGVPKTVNIPANTNNATVSIEDPKKYYTITDIKVTSADAVYSYDKITNNVKDGKFPVSVGLSGDGFAETETLSIGTFEYDTPIDTIKTVIEEKIQERINDFSTYYNPIEYPDTLPSTMPDPELVVSINLTYKEYTVTIAPGSLYTLGPTAPSLEAMDKTLQIKYNDSIVDAINNKFKEPAYARAVEFDDITCNDYALNEDKMPAQDISIKINSDRFNSYPCTFTYNGFVDGHNEENVDKDIPYNTPLKQWALDNNIIKTIAGYNEPTLTDEFSTPISDSTRLLSTSGKIITLTYTPKTVEINYYIGDESAPYTTEHATYYTEIDTITHPDKPSDTAEWSYDGYDWELRGDDADLTHVPADGLSYYIGRDKQTYTVSFTLSGDTNTYNTVYGNLPNILEQSVAYGEAATVPVVDIEKGFSVEWPVDMDTSTITANTTYQGTIAANTVTVRYETVQGKVVSGVSGTTTAGSLITAEYAVTSGITQDVEGYTLSENWTVNAGNDNIVDDKYIVGDVTFRKTYEPNEYTITYKVQYPDGSQHDEATVTVKFGQPIDHPVLESNEDYEFDNLWISEDGEAYETMPAKDLTYISEATKKTYTVNFTINDAPSTYESIQYAWGEPLANLVLPTLVDTPEYTYGDWALVDYNETTMPKHDITYNATETRRQYTVSFYKVEDDEETQFTAVTKEYGTTLQSIAGEITKPTDTPAYTYSEWMKTGQVGITPADIVESDVNLYSYASLIEYEIGLYNDEGLADLHTATTCANGTEFTLPEDYIASNADKDFYFKKSGDTAAIEQKIVNNKFTMPTNNVVVYPKEAVVAPLKVYAVTMTQQDLDRADEKPSEYAEHIIQSVNNNPNGTNPMDKDEFGFFVNASTSFDWSDISTEGKNQIKLAYPSQSPEASDLTDIINDGNYTEEDLYERMRLYNDEVVSQRIFIPKGQVNDLNTINQNSCSLKLINLTGLNQPLNGDFTYKEGYTLSIDGNEYECIECAPPRVTTLEEFEEIWGGTSNVTPMTNSSSLMTIKIEKI